MENSTSIKIHEPNIIKRQPSDNRKLKHNIVLKIKQNFLSFFESNLDIHSHQSNQSIIQVFINPSKYITTLRDPNPNPLNPSSQDAILLLMLITLADGNAVRGDALAKGLVELVAPLNVPAHDLGVRADGRLHVLGVFERRGPGVHLVHPPHDKVKRLAPRRGGAPHHVLFCGVLGRKDAKHGQQGRTRRGLADRVAQHDPLLARDARQARAGAKLLGELHVDVALDARNLVGAEARDAGARVLGGEVFGVRVDGELAHAFQVRVVGDGLRGVVRCPLAPQDRLDARHGVVRA